jgi:hypothetical protein
MDGPAVKELASRFRSPTELGGFLLRPNDWLADDPASLIKAGPSAKTLAVATLGALCEYLKGNRDQLPLDQVVVHVAGPGSVSILGPLDKRARGREVFVTAVASDLTEGFLGRFMALEDFMIGLQVRFWEGDDRMRLVSLLSNIKSETVKTALDDGVTQVVQARAGVALVSEVAVPNPVRLCPFRTFRELQQPSSFFVLRVQSGKEGGLPQAGLFEADGGAWKLIAIDRVREWLIGALPAGLLVLA